MTEHEDQSYEAKLARFLEGVNRQLAPRITALTLVGPMVPFLTREEHQRFYRHGVSEFVISKCSFCNPPPKVYKCPVCDWETEDKWRMKMHNDSNPRWCQQRGARKVRKWARHA